jgi:hypothetical protein
MFKFRFVYPVDWNLSFYRQVHYYRTGIGSKNPCEWTVINFSLAQKICSKLNTEYAAIPDEGLGKYNSNKIRFTVEKCV